MVSIEYIVTSAYKGQTFIMTAYSGSEDSCQLSKKQWECHPQ